VGSNGGPAANNHHAASAVPFEGRLHVPQRFAIDFVRIYEDRQMFHGDRKDVRSHRSYGAQALAVADTAWRWCGTEPRITSRIWRSRSKCSVETR
jgi:hypothetical protein